MAIDGARVAVIPAGTALRPWLRGGSCTATTQLHFAVHAGAGIDRHPCPARIRWSDNHTALFQRLGSLRVTDGDIHNYHDIARYSIDAGATCASRIWAGGVRYQDPFALERGRQTLLRMN